MVFIRYEKVNEAVIGDDENLLVKSIVSYDPNASYHYAVQRDSRPTM